MIEAQLTKEQLLELLAQKDALLSQKEEQITQKEQRINFLEEKVRYLVTKKFGAESEKIPADQLALFEANSEEDTASDESEDKVKISFERKRRCKRRKIDESLERHTIEYELNESDRACDCGGCLKPISTRTSEQYEYIPARVVAIQHVEHQYICSCCNAMVRAKKPPQALPKTNAGPGLLARITAAEWANK